MITNTDNNNKSTHEQEESRKLRKKLVFSLDIYSYI